LEELGASRDRYDENVSVQIDLTVEHVLPNKWATYWTLADKRCAPERRLVRCIWGSLRDTNSEFRRNSFAWAAAAAKKACGMIFRRIAIPLYFFA
jgi:hypothetical protein